MTSVIKSVAKVALPVVGAYFGGPIGGAIGGAVGGAIGGGGIKGAAIGAALGGAGGYVSGAGGFSNAAQNLGLGTVAGSPLAGTIGPSLVGNSGVAGFLNTAGNAVGSLGGNKLLSLASLAGGAIQGKMGADAAKSAAATEAGAIDRATKANADALAQQRADLAPYAAAGKSTVNSLTNLVNDPTAQADFINNNPFFNTLAAKAKDDLYKTAAATGKLGSGGTLDALQNSYLLLGNSLLQQNITDKQNLVATGANAASGQATATQSNNNNLIDLATGKGAVNAAGIIGANNAQNAGVQNGINTAIQLQKLQL